MLQEIGGVLLTTNILCAANNTEPDDLLEKELARVLSKPPEHFAKRNQEKVDGGLDIADDVIEYVPASDKHFRVLPSGERIELPRR